MKEMSSVFISDTETSPEPTCAFAPGHNCPLAQAYVPPQPFESPSTPEQSLICGTAFSALSMPYTSIFAPTGKQKEGLK